MLRRSPATLAVLAGCAAVPVALLALFGNVMFMPPMWVHFYGVGVTALVAMAAAVFLMVAGAQQKDARTVVVAGGFALMAALLAVHGLMTPGVLVGMNGLISVTGAATLSVGAAVLSLSVLSPFAAPTAIPRVLGVQAALAVAVITLSLVGALFPSARPDELEMRRQIEQVSGRDGRKEVRYALDRVEASAGGALRDVSGVRGGSTEQRDHAVDVHHQQRSRGRLAGHRAAGRGNARIPHRCRVFTTSRKVFSLHRGSDGYLAGTVDPPTPVGAE